MYSDTHVHTCFSFDSEMDPESAVKKAADLGLFSITFTDHFDLDYPGYGDTVCFDFDKYIETIDELKEKYEKKLRIKIFKGVEVGIRPHVMDRELSAVKGMDSLQYIAQISAVYGSLSDEDRQKVGTEEYRRFF